MPSSERSEQKNKHEPIRSYGRRRGKKLRPGRERLLDDLLPEIKFTTAKNALSQFPPATTDVWLEIGFGGGEHIAAQALLNPGVGLIGCEPFINGVASLLDEIDKKSIANVRIWPDDGRDIFPSINDGELGRVFILFPDPWPKKRHAKRRLLAPETLDELARMLRPGAVLMVASDHMDYVRYALGALTRHPAFAWTAESADDWRMAPDGWPGTRYEKKALKQGIKPAYLLFRRV